MPLHDEPVFENDQETTEKIRKPREILPQIRNLLEKEPFCVLCTQGQSQPYGSLIAFAYSDDLRHLYFTTPKATRKYKLLTDCSGAAFLVDNRRRYPDDMIRVEAVTITAQAVQIDPADSVRGLELLQLRHPYLIEFLKADTTALFRADAVRYFHVCRFQEVTQWAP